MDSTFGYMLKVEPTEFADRLDVVSPPTGHFPGTGPGIAAKVHRDL